MKAICRPGGFEITEKAVEICAFPAGARLLDCGCGEGATVEWLNAAGFDALGVDIAGGEGIIKADAAALPFETDVFDGLFFECSFSKMAQPQAAAEEAFRVLKPGGFVAVSDFYAIGEPYNFTGGLLGRVEKQEDIISRFESAGFSLFHRSEHSEYADALCASLVFRHGAERFYEMIGSDRETLKKVHCGYALFVFRKAETEEIWNR